MLATARSALRDGDVLTPGPRWAQESSQEANVRARRLFAGLEHTTIATIRFSVHSRVRATSASEHSRLASIRGVRTIPVTTARKQYVSESARLAPKGLREVSGRQSRRCQR